MSLAPPSAAHHQYLRKYNIKVITFRGEAIDVSELRCTFSMDKKIIGLYQSAEINIYNLHPETETDILLNGQYVILEAGYENGAYGVIFEGYIYQPIRGKEDDAVTTFLRLVCIDGYYASAMGICNITLAAGQDGLSIAKQVCRASSIPFDLESDVLSQQKTTRGKTISGNPIDILRNIAINNNAAFYFNHGKARISTLSKAPPQVVQTLNAQTGLVGMPHQTDEGINLKCLINPNLDLDSWVKLDNQSIIQNQLGFGVPQTLLDMDGLYRIIAIEATGDTRGQEWYFDITAINQLSSLPSMFTSPSQSGF
jgi:hypothetical protein